MDILIISAEGLLPLVCQKHLTELVISRPFTYAINYLAARNGPPDPYNTHITDLLWMLIFGRYPWRANMKDGMKSGQLQKHTGGSRQAQGAPEPWTRAGCLQFKAIVLPGLCAPLSRVGQSLGGRLAHGVTCSPEAAPGSPDRDVALRRLTKMGRRAQKLDLQRLACPTAFEDGRALVLEWQPISGNPSSLPAGIF